MTHIEPNVSYLNPFVISLILEMFLAPLEVFWCILSEISINKL
jgi:hypothetical protein